MTTKQKGNQARIFQAVRLLLRDDQGHPNHDALDVFRTEYEAALREGMSVQASGEVALRVALGCP